MVFSCRYCYHSIVFQVHFKLLKSDLEDYGQIISDWGNRYNPHCPALLSSARFLFADDILSLRRALGNYYPSTSINRYQG